MSKIKKLEKKLKYYQIEYYICGFIGFFLAFCFGINYAKEIWFFPVLISFIIFFGAIEIILYFTYLK